MSLTARSACRPPGNSRQSIGTCTCMRVNVACAETRHSGFGPNFCDSVQSGSTEDGDVHGEHASQQLLITNTHMHARAMLRMSRRLCIAKVVSVAAQRRRVFGNTPPLTSTYR